MFAYSRHGPLWTQPLHGKLQQTGYDVSDLHTFDQEEPELTIFVLPHNPNQPQE